MTCVNQKSDFHSTVVNKKELVRNRWDKEAYIKNRDDFKYTNFISTAIFLEINLLLVVQLLLYK